MGVLKAVAEVNETEPDGDDERRPQCQSRGTPLHFSALECNARLDLCQIRTSDITWIETKQVLYWKKNQVLQNIVIMGTGVLQKIGLID